MSRLIVSDLPIEGLKLIERQPIGDNRGFFSRVFCAEELARCGWGKPIAQINHSFTAKQGVVRGLHYQHAPYAEMKLVTCLAGEIWDVAVDLRADSPTFLKWHAVHLSAKNKLTLLIPEGVAHGFQTLTENVQILYCHSQAYQKNSEGGVNIAEPRLAINWPLPITECSLRDQSFPLLDVEYTGEKM